MNLRMSTVLAVVMLTVAGCAPKTNHVAPHIDTPARHVANGMVLLADHKIEAAVGEFNRALDLDRTYAPAYVGLGLANGQKGALQIGFDFMDRAASYAHGEAQQKLVRNGYARLKALQRKEK